MNTRVVGICLLVWLAVFANQCQAQTIEVTAIKAAPLVKEHSIEVLEKDLIKTNSADDQEFAQICGPYFLLVGPLTPAESGEGYLHFNYKATSESKPTPAFVPVWKVRPIIDEKRKDPILRRYEGQESWDVILNSEDFKKSSDCLPHVPPATVSKVIVK